MARELIFKLGGSDYGAAPVKLERKKIYGWTDTVATDKDGKEPLTMFEFNYIKGTNHNDGYLMNTPGGLFLFAGDKQEFPLVSLAEETTIDDNEEPEDESIDELDFSMF